MRDGEIIRFRGLKQRTLEDQQRAMEAGYSSMYEYAIDELGQIVLELQERVEKLEQSRGVNIQYPALDNR